MTEPSSAGILPQLRSPSAPPGRADLLMRPATFSVREVAALTQAYADEIATVRADRPAAFDAELMRWAA